MDNLKNFSLQLNSRFLIASGLWLMVLAAIASFLDYQNLMDELAIYAYFALLAGVLAQIWELRFGVDPVAWVFKKIEKVFGVVFGFYFKVALAALAISGFWLRDVLGARGALLNGIFGKALVWYNQDFFWHPINGQGLVRLEKLGILAFYWLVVFVLVIGIIGLLKIVRRIGQRKPLVDFRLPIFYPKGLLIETSLLLILGYLAFVYFPPKTYLINEFVSTKILGREAAYSQDKVLVLWKVASGFLIAGVAWLLFSPLGWRKRSYFRLRWVNLQLKTAYLGYSFLVAVSLLLIGESFKLLQVRQKESFHFYPVTALFAKIEASLPVNLNSQVVYLPPRSKKGEPWANAYLSKHRSFGIADSQKKTFEYLWWQILYGKGVDYADLLKQEKVRFLIYQKNLGPSSLEQDLILAGLKSKKFLKLFAKNPDYLIYEFPDWQEEASQLLSYELDEEREFSVLFDKRPQLPIIGGINQDLMRMKQAGNEETIEILHRRLKEGEWWAVGSRKFDVEELSRYFVGIDWQNRGVVGLHAYLKVFGKKEGKQGQLLEQFKILESEKLGQNFDWQKQWASFETPRGAKEVNFTFYFRPDPDRSTSWSIRNLQIMSAQKFAGLSP